MAKTLARLEGCSYLSPSQGEHVSAAERHINEAVSEWIDDVMDDASPSSRRSHPVEPLTPEHPERGLDCVLDMLAIYHDDVNERDFTHLQVQRLTIAAHNLLVVAQEIEKSAH